MTRTIRLPIVNLRLGHACNSSSSHSLLIRRGVLGDDQVDDGEFGWAWFTASSVEAKRKYFALGLVDALTESIGDTDLARIVASGLSDVPVPVLESGHIDHQSRPLIPRAWNGKGIDVDFVKAWRAFLDREDVAILGGNDNEEWSHRVGSGEVTRHPDGECAPAHVCRRDGGNLWTLFNRETGARFSLDFSATTSAGYAPNTIADRPMSFPWLVDLKITDACDTGCAYCYQGSTPEGKHAPTRAIRDILDALETGRCFEVAIGGGEPTLHPDLIAILEYARERGVVPNITTRNVKLLTSPAGKELVELVGRVAVSVDSVAQAKRVTTDAPKWLSRKVNIQIVDGVMTSPALSQVLTLSGYTPVTLLGYKTTGRGSLMKPKHLGSWRKCAEVETWSKGKRARFPFTVDTAFLQTYKDDPAMTWADPRTMLAAEGRVSAYIDAVARKMYRSSYDLSVSADLPSTRYYPDGVDHHLVPKAWQAIRV